MRTIIGYLDTNDLERYRRSYSTSVVALGGHPGQDFAQAAEIIYRDVLLVAELREKHGIQPGQDVSFALSDGAILEVSGG